MKIGDATDIKLGTSSVSSVYLGTNLVWVPEWKGLTIEAVDSCRIRFNVYTDIIQNNLINSLSYSTDNINWTSVTLSTSTTMHVHAIDVNLSPGEKLYVRADALALAIQDNGGNYSWYQSYFTSDGRYKVYGNIMSMLYDDNFEGQTTIPDFSSIYNAPASALGGLFAFSSNLIDASGLELPATTLFYYCYLGMFQGCTSLTTAPELPTTTLGYGCYMNMFNGCTSLTTAPELPAATLTGYCYYNMFNGCSNLNYIKMLATDISAQSCLDDWVDGVAASGTFIKNVSMTTLPTGVSGIPSGWTVQNAAS